MLNYFLNNFFIIVCELKNRKVINNFVFQDISTTSNRLTKASSPENDKSSAQENETTNQISESNVENSEQAQEQNDENVEEAEQISSMPNLQDKVQQKLHYLVIIIFYYFFLVRKCVSLFIYLFFLSIYKFVYLM